MPGHLASTGKTMHNSVQPRAIAPKNFLHLAAFPSAFDAQTRADQGRLVDSQFIQMLNGYRDSGGLAKLQELATLNANGSLVDMPSLAGLIGHRELICFEWQALVWLPLFQFDLATMQPHQGLRRIVRELSCICDPWDLARWFVQPNPWLAERLPADALGCDCDAVFDAARAHRFIAS